MVVRRAVLGILALAEELYDRRPTNLEDLVQSIPFLGFKFTLVTHMLLPENSLFGLLKHVYGLKALKKQCSL